MAELVPVAHHGSPWRFFNMNRLICCSLVGASLATSGANVSAQSLSLYGELDTGLAYVSNVSGHTQYLATSGLIDGSYWGLQGTEELGDGTQALFRLERGFTVTSGEDLNDHP